MKTCGLSSKIYNFLEKQPFSIQHSSNTREQMESLANIPEAKAKSILLALCADNSHLRERALQFLQDIDALEDDVAAGNYQKGTKRKAQSLIMICIQCQSPFYEEDNSDKDCEYHNGKCDIYVVLPSRLTLREYNEHITSCIYLRYDTIYANLF